MKGYASLRITNPVDGNPFRVSWGLPQDTSRTGSRTPAGLPQQSSA
ncbi:hypothetical protein AB0C52_33105 [Streptomyces sp. NPDC048717]